MRRPYFLQQRKTLFLNFIGGGAILLIASVVFMVLVIAGVAAAASPGVILVAGLIVASTCLLLMHIQLSSSTIEHISIANLQQTTALTKQSVDQNYQVGLDNLAHIKQTFDRYCEIKEKIKDLLVQATEQANVEAIQELQVLHVEIDADIVAILAMHDEMLGLINDILAIKRKSDAAVEKTLALKLQTLRNNGPTTELRDVSKRLESIRELYHYQ